MEVGDEVSFEINKNRLTGKVLKIYKNVNRELMVCILVSTYPYAIWDCEVVIPYTYF
jgi:hypothetical protein